MSDDGQAYTVDAAREAAARGELGDWVARFLSSPGSDNAPLADQLFQSHHSWFGPVEVHIDQLHRLAGPPDAPVLCPVDEDDWGDDVDEMAELAEEGWEPPPVIVTFRDDQLVLEDGNHRVESLRRAGVHETWAVIGFENRTDRDRFADALAASP